MAAIVSDAELSDDYYSSDSDLENFDEPTPKKATLVKKVFLI